MTIKRGALLVLEGCDRAGKSTQVKKLVQELNSRGIKAEARRFPDNRVTSVIILPKILMHYLNTDRRTAVGKLIDQFLSRAEDLPSETIHLLFSANRWECSTEMMNTISSGTTLVVDRYAGSGAAYTAATTDRDLSWCKEPDRGLPKPDLVALLEVSEQTQVSRTNWGGERFERTEVQRKVATNLRRLMDETWVTVDGNDGMDKIHEKLLSLALATIEKAKSHPLETLYNSKPL